MNVRQWLWSARGINKEIAKYKEALQRARDRASRITQNYSADVAQSSKDPHTKLDTIAEYISLIEEKETALDKARLEIAKVVLALPDWRQRTVAFAYFCECDRMEKIASDMGYSFRQAKRIKNRAVESIERVLECPPTSVI